MNLILVLTQRWVLDSKKMKYKNYKKNYSNPNFRLKISMTNSTLVSRTLKKTIKSRSSNKKRHNMRN